MNDMISELSSLQTEDFTLILRKAGVIFLF